MKKTNYVYNGQIQKPAIVVNYKGKVLKLNQDFTLKYSGTCRTVGTYTVFIQGKGKYKDTVQKKFNILPPKTSIITANSDKSATIKIRWKKISSQIMGYQIRYSIHKNMKSAKNVSITNKKISEKTITNLKKQAGYYIQIRTYNYVQKKGYYSPWSETKYVKTLGTQTKPKPTKSPYPTLKFLSGKSKNKLQREDSLFFRTSNKIKKVTISNDKIIKQIDTYPDYLWVQGREAGKATITITDIYGQKITAAVAVTQQIETKNGNKVTITSVKSDSSLPVPILDSREYSDQYLSLNYKGSFLSTDKYDGYEVYLSWSNNFKDYIQMKYTDTEMGDNYGNISFYSYMVPGSRYYVKARSYKLKGKTKLIGSWGKTYRIDIPDYWTKQKNKAKYSYEIYFLDKYGKNMYSKCMRPIYIKTKNPDPNTINLISGSQSIFQNITNGTGQYFDDIHYTLQSDEQSLLKKVKGGYIGYAEFDKAGTYKTELREYSLKGYTVVKTINFKVKDYKKEATAWVDSIIAKTTTKSMTPFEKMSAVCEYLTKPGRFRYVTVLNDNYVTLASEPNDPCFKTHRWDSYTSPDMLCLFAERIGGFTKIHNCYGDYPIGSAEWYDTHFWIKLSIGKETERFAVCPLSETGEIKKIKYIDFSKLPSSQKIA